MHLMLCAAHLFPDTVLRVRPRLFSTSFVVSSSLPWPTAVSGISLAKPSRSVFYVIPRVTRLGLVPSFLDLVFFPVIFSSFLTLFPAGRHERDHTNNNNKPTASFSLVVRAAPPVAGHSFPPGAQHRGALPRDRPRLALHQLRPHRPHIQRHPDLYRGGVALWGDPLALGFCFFLFHLDCVAPACTRISRPRWRWLRCLFLYASIVNVCC